MPYTRAIGKTTSQTLNCNKTIDGYLLACGKTEGDTIDSYSLSCTKTLGAYYNGETRVYETCSDVVTSIEPVVATQNIERARIDFNIKVTYLDGHTRIMLPSSSDYDSTKDYNGEDVILYYTGEINKAGEQGTLSTTINLTTK